MAHFQNIQSTAQEQAKVSKTEMALILNPYADSESEQLGYIPVAALDMFKHYIVLGYVSQAGDVTLRNNY